MARLSFGLRCVGALMAAIVIFTVVFAIGAVLGQSLHANPISIYRTTLWLATPIAIMGGALIMPRQNWQAAALALWLLILLVPAWMFVSGIVLGRFRPASLMELGDVLVSGFAAYYAVRVTARARKINRVAGQT